MSESLLLGGAASPIGWSVSFLAAPVDRVLANIRGFRPKIEVADAKAYPECLYDLPPFEAPWTRELLIEAGEWTAYLNNGLRGGDGSAAAPAIGRDMNVRCVVATNAPRYGPGHAATQLGLMGPEGQPPLMYVRAIEAHAEDGRWSWYVSGDVQEFEEPERYEARRIRDRFDRELLVEYLGALGICPDDPEFFGLGTVVQAIVDWSVRSEPLEKHRRELGLDD